MNDHSDACCIRCAYFRPSDALTGLCHRYPPVFAGDSSPREAHHWRHPVVGPHGWCGEHRLAPGVQISSSGATS
ncbi:MAG: hypothetical protein IV101_01265 [Dechloromonas sp.]|uniref:hypothetical protein n=1 Tax=Dechloromonas sp. TaxID=1917218 RepID=UPI0027FF63E4|nr:hypothetical protein [Dechloromonas sp.]MBT9519496.1 hypothetical protein [Dechloromonas sp.]